MNVLLMYQPRPGHLSALNDAAPGAKFCVANDQNSAKELIRDADIVLGNRFFVQSLPYAKKLVWMQSNSVGVDKILEYNGSGLKEFILTCSRGVYDDEVAEHAMALSLGLYRGLHIAQNLRHQKNWARHRLQTLRGKRALILGWGGIGRGIARQLAAFGVSVQGVRRTQHGSPSPDGEQFLILGPGTWRDVLPESDLLILALPKTKTTRGLVGHHELHALSQGGVVVNVSRGEIINEQALCSVLDDGHLYGAALDVFADEPLPNNHWAWTHPAVLMTPHWARSLESPPYRWESCFVENLRRFAIGDELLNVVDKVAGY